MDVREKLVELIGSTEYGNGSFIGSNFQKGFIEKIATHLIASGVTVQEWISVKDKLPEDSGLHITFGSTAVPELRLLNFDKDMGKFGVWWDYDTAGRKHPRYRFIEFETEDITHWMPLPEPPEGE